MNFESLQNMISKIDGVINIKLVIEENDLKEVHILASSTRAPKQIVRDIESALLAAFDYRIDRKIISIAQIASEEYGEIRRVRFGGISFRTESSALECSVTLIHDGEEFSEAVTGVKTSANRKKIVAEAAVKSVEKVLGQAYLFSVEDVIVSTTRDISFATVLVNMVLGDNEERMVGSAIVRQDVNEAIVKATLDALNRRIERSKI
jgi:hypothetical protein